MRAYRTETFVGEGGTITLHDLPLNPDQRVEVIVLATDAATPPNPYPLRDQPYRYDDQFEPVWTPNHTEMRFGPYRARIR